MSIDGGQAFPRNPAVEWDGMTLRDYFAAQAMAIAYDASKENPNGWEGVAVRAYNIAEAMIAERKKRNTK